jgi:hypothetical protein
VGLLLTVAVLACAVGSPVPAYSANPVAVAAKKKCKKKARPAKKKKCKKRKATPSPVPVPLTLTITPANYDFGSWTAGTSSPSRAFVITNTGYASSKITVTLGDVVSGIFIFTGGSTCGTPVPPGGTCQTNLRFDAQGNQTWTATLKAIAPDAYGITGQTTIRGTSHP